MALPPADWYPDPTGRHELRYWDGNRWTDHVADAGEASVDPLQAALQEQADERPAETSAADTSAGDSSAAADGPVVDATIDDGEPVTAPAQSWPPADQAAPDTAAPDASPEEAPAATGQVTGDLLSGIYAPRREPGPLVLQHAGMLRVTLGDELLAAPDAVSAVQGVLDETDDAEGMRRFSGRGELYLARPGTTVHVLALDGAGVTLPRHRLVAADAALELSSAPGAEQLTVQGRGWVAVAARGVPVVLDAEAAEVAADAAVCWSAELTTDDASGRLQFSGRGFVAVDAGEGR